MAKGLYKTKLKKGDNVEVIAGNYRGSKGKILFLDRAKGKVIVEGVNIMHRHTKPNQKNPQGGIVRREAPINISNVMMICPKTNEKTRLGAEVHKDEKTGKERRMRLSRKSGEAIIS